jgi:hypothetical protein
MIFSEGGKDAMIFYPINAFNRVKGGQNEKGRFYFDGFCVFN